MADFSMDLDAIEGEVVFVRGDDFVKTFRIHQLVDDVPVYPNLSDWTLEGHVRSGPPPAPVIAVMTVTADPDQETFPGTFTVWAHKEDTTEWPDDAKGDVQFTNPQSIRRTFLRLLFTVKTEYTIEVP